ncbi:MAG: hypothetical protein IKM04_01990 [Clostridia bacterium]|nr:hypothetical protein [Clostridia bacterium]
MGISFPKNSKYGRKLSEKDFVIWLCVFSAIFAVMNYRLLLEVFVVDVWRGIMSLITFLFWVGMMYSAGRAAAFKALIVMAVIWGGSLIYGGLNLAVTDPENLNAAVSIGILVFSPFASATVIALVPGLLFLGYYPSSMAEYILIGVFCMVLFAACWLLGMKLSGRTVTRQKKMSTPHIGDTDQ